MPFTDGLAQLNRLQTLFLCTLFLYPFAAAGHTLYMVPQALLLALGLIVLPKAAAPNAMLMKVAVCALAFVSSSTAIFREVLADRSEFLEPVKLLINLSTVLLFLFLQPTFDPASCAKWLKRFAVLWLLIVVGAYIHAGTSSFEMLLLLLRPEGVTSTRLYEIAEPLAPIFLTKNIVAMYVVALFGAFLYFKRCAREPVTLLERALFSLLVLSLFSRQGILSAALLLALDYFLTREKKLKRWVFIGFVITALVIGSFIAFAFDFSNPEDGAAARLDLWRVFFTHWTSYAFVGLGVHQLNASLEHLDIDNYHMFFMNQVAAYGIVHCIAFNALLTIITLRSLPKKIRWLVIAPYWLNVCFQTYGYEYGNLFLYCIAGNSCNLGIEQVPELSAPVYGLNDPLRVS
jgi:hypothetical protein